MNRQTDRNDNNIPKDLVLVYDADFTYKQIRYYLWIEAPIWYVIASYLALC